MSVWCPPCFFVEDHRRDDPEWFATEQEAKDRIDEIRRRDKDADVSLLAVDGSRIERREY